MLLQIIGASWTCQRVKVDWIIHVCAALMSQTKRIIHVTHMSHYYWIKGDSTITNSLHIQVNEVGFIRSMFHPGLNEITDRNNMHSRHRNENNRLSPVTKNKRIHLQTKTVKTALDIGVYVDLSLARIKPIHTSWVTKAYNYIAAQRA